MIKAEDIQIGTKQGSKLRPFVLQIALEGGQLVHIKLTEEQTRSIVDSYLRIKAR